MAPPLVTPMTMKRINREVADLRRDRDQLGGIVLEPTDDLFVWKARIPGPEGSPYESGEFQVDVRLSHDYPFSAPKVQFVTRIYHMNISDRGGVCIDILKHNWSPALSVFKVILSLSSLLTDPNPNDPLVPSIATEYVRNRQQHDKTARHWTELYALPPKPKPTVTEASAPPGRAKGKGRAPAAAAGAAASSSAPASVGPTSARRSTRHTATATTTSGTSPGTTATAATAASARATSPGTPIEIADSDSDEGAGTGGTARSREAAAGRGKRKRRADDEGAQDADGPGAVSGNGSGSAAAAAGAKRRSVDRAARRAAAAAAGAGEWDVITIDD